MLKDKNPNETIVKKDNKGEIIWRNVKKYQGSELKIDETSLGLEIDILQESINKTHTEYLVIFEYFTKILDLYGFIPCPPRRFKSFWIKKHIGSFLNYLI